MTNGKKLFFLLLLLSAFVQGVRAQEYITVYAESDSQEDWMKYNGQEVGKFTINNRTLYKDGSWNTLCLPFDLTIWGSMLNDGEARTLESSSFANGTLTLNFSEPVDELKAGVPYIIKWSSDADLTYLDFGTVTLNTSLNPVHTDCVDFVGNYSPVNLAANDNTKLYLGTNSTLYYPTKDRTIGICRAYFELNGLVAGEKISEARAIVMNFNEETSGIVDMDFKSACRESENSNRFQHGWFTLDGRSLNGKPTECGIYIHNGMKVVIRQGENRTVLNSLAPEQVINESEKEVVK